MRELNKVSVAGLLKHLIGTKSHKKIIAMMTLVIAKAAAFFQQINTSIIFITCANLMKYRQTFAIGIKPELSFQL